MRILLLASILLAFCISGNAAKPQPVTAKSWLVADADGKIIKGENTTVFVLLLALPNWLLQ
jgi:hypothetical protein